MEADAENNLTSYRAQIQLINPFQTNNKVSIASNSNASPSRRHAEETITTQDDNMNLNTEPGPPEHSPTHFVDKKYYDIFKQ